MENCYNDKYEFIKKALKEIGYEVEGIEKHDKKTIITVHQCKIQEEKSLIPEEI